MCHVTISLLNKYEKIGREEYNFLKLEAIKFIPCQTNYLTLGTTILIGILLRAVGLIRINNTSTRTRGFSSKIGSQMSGRCGLLKTSYKDYTSTVQYSTVCSRMLVVRGMLSGLRAGFSSQRTSSSHHYVSTCTHTQATVPCAYTIRVCSKDLTGHASTRLLRQF